MNPRLVAIRHICARARKKGTRFLVGGGVFMAIALFFGLVGLVNAHVGGLALVSEAHAQFNLPKCKAGVHLISPSDEDYVEAAQLLHANNGEYCWMTVVFREDEMTTENLQRIHNIARRNRFQILHRIEKGFDQQGNWLMPDEGTVQAFIDALAGKKDGERVAEPVRPYAEDLFVVLGNEPTHAAMCGGCTPEQFAQWSMQGVRMLHDAQDELDMTIHVGMAGHDLASPQLPGAGLYDAGIFMDRMFEEEPDLLCEVDMWVSHNYPRSFVGPAGATGRLSPRGYEWELNYASARATPECAQHVRELPVFISETGYKAGLNGVSYEDALRGADTIIAQYEADPRVHMYSFFVYRACGEPFETFALAGCDLRTLNGVGQALRDAPKRIGDVRHKHQARTRVVCPDKLVENMEVECEIVATNLGTDIWQDIGGYYGLALIGAPTGEGEGPLVGDTETGNDTSSRGNDAHNLPEVTELEEPRVEFGRFRGIEPGNDLTVRMKYNPADNLGLHKLTIGLMRKGRLVLGLANWNVETFAAPDLTLRVEGFFGQAVDAEDVQVQVFNENEDIVYRETVEVADGKVTIDGVSGVGFGPCYRIVMLVEGNLPVQKQCVQFETGTNEIEMPRLLAVDRNGDGRLSFADVLSRTN